MKEHDFTLILTTDPSEEVADQLYSMCDDGTLSTIAGMPQIHFHREARSLEEAIRSAITSVRSAGFDVARVEIEPEAVAQSVTSVEITTLIAKLRRLSDDHGFRATTLVPDLAFVGLVQDAIDAAEAALELLSTSRPYRAYSMARICFEAAQRLLPLAVTDDYVRLGTRAWVYYRRKDAAVAGATKDSLGESGEQILEIWANYNPAARALAHEALAALRSQKGPDNFLGRNLAETATECYKVLASTKGVSFPPDAVAVNRAIYSSLSRDTHACVRLEPRGLWVDADGFAEVIERHRELPEVIHGVSLALDSCLREATAAVEYRLETRQRQEAALRMASLAMAPSTTRTDYAPDFGRLLAEQGIGHAECVFPGVPLQHIRELPDSTLSISLNHGYGAERYLATFDFKGKVRIALLDRVREQFPELATAGSRRAPLRLDLPEPITVTIRAILGKVQHTSEESFVPFVVQSIE